MKKFVSYIIGFVVFFALGVYWGAYIQNVKFDNFKKAFNYQMRIADFYRDNFYIDDYFSNKNQFLCNLEKSRNSNIEILKKCAADAECKEYLMPDNPADFYQRLNMAYTNSCEH